jgi:hypothetical protein
MKDSMGSTPQRTEDQRSRIRLTEKVKAAG